MQSYSLSYPLFLIKKIPLRVNLKFLLIIETFLTIFLLLAVLFQVNLITNLDYQSQSFQKESEKIAKDNKLLEIDFANKNSLKNVEEKIKDLGFKPIDKVYYLEIIDSAVASK